MGTLDIILLLLFIPGVIRGLSKGFLEQATALVGVFMSAWLSFKFSSAVSPWIGQYLPTVSETALHVVAFAAILVAGLLATVLLAKLLTKVAEMVLLGWLDRALGLVGAVAVTALLLSLGIILFDTVNVKFALVQESILRDSVLYGPLKDFGYFVFPYLKELLLKH